MKEIKQFTIQTADGIEKCICDDIESYLAAICYCDKYEIIKEEKLPVLAEKFNEYYNAIPAEQFDFPDAVGFWENNVFMLLSGYYETFDEMLENNKYE